LLPVFFIDSELAKGDLVAAVNRPMESSEAYYLAWPLDRETYPPLQAFRHWIREEAGRQASDAQ